jgi:hypothetical protein
MEIISRNEALLAGKSRYFTGVPCRNGHIAERYVNQGQCIGCISKFKRFAPNPYTSELVPWNPGLYYVPQGLTPALYQELQGYLAHCVEAWVAHKGLLTNNITLAYAKRRQYLEERARKESEQKAGK